MPTLFTTASPLTLKSPSTPCSSFSNAFNTSKSLLSAYFVPCLIPLPKCDSDGEESAYNVGDLGQITGSIRYPGEGNGYPLQYSGLENFMDLQSMGLQRVGHDWATFTFTHPKYSDMLKICLNFGYSLISKEGFTPFQSTKKWSWIQLIWPKLSLDILKVRGQGTFGRKNSKPWWDFLA